MLSKLICALAMASGAAFSMSHAHSIQSRDTSYGAPHAGGSNSYTAPLAGGSRQAPASGYSAPSGNYAAPGAGYAAPGAGYAAPGAGYGAPGSNYGVSSVDGSSDLTLAVLVILGIFGLSFLFPTFVSVNTRKKRSASEVNPMLDVVDRVNDIYSAVAQSEECMERIACELGGIVADSTSYGKYARLATGFVPSQYKKLYKKFASGKNCHKIACGTLDF